jgi:hypothetical protein
LTWLWILIPVLMVFLASTIVVIVFAIKLITGPVETTNSYYSDLRNRDYAGAYTELCGSLRSQISRTGFIELQQGDERTKGRVTSYNFSNSEIHNHSAVVTGDVERGGSRYSARLALSRENGDWKVCGVRER